MSGLGHAIRSLRLRRARKHLAALPRFIEGAPPQGLDRLSTYTRAVETSVARAKTSLARRYGQLSATATTPPKRTDWQHVPDLWSMRVTPSGVVPALGQSRIGEAEVFQDGDLCEITCHQRLTGTKYHVTIDTLGFDGTYLSLAIKAPDSIMHDLTSSALIGAVIAIDAEAPLTAHLRVNVRHGPNVEKLVQAVRVNTGAETIEFDVFHTTIETTDVSEVWFDVILEHPGMNLVTISEMQFFRRPRAHV